MKLSKREYQLVQSVLTQWVRNRQIETEKAGQLADSLEVKTFDWQLLARYAFWGAMACVLASLAAVVADEQLMALIQHLFNAPDGVKSAGFMVLSALFVGVGLKVQKRTPERVLVFDGVYFLAVVGIAIAVFFLGKALDTGSGHFSLLILLASLVYLLLGGWLVSRLVWFFGLVAFGAWFGAETGYQSDWSSVYRGMNYLLRYGVFGALLLVSAMMLRGRLYALRRVTEASGMLCLFVSLWALTLFGNQPDLEFLTHWQALPWSVLLLAVSILAMIVGQKADNEWMRVFGLSFLLINLYTRFFEYFWGEMHEALFFVLLALALWLPGRYAERLWLLGKPPG